MEVKANNLSGNVPSGPTPVSGGVVVSTNPYFGGSAKPKNNSVTGNNFGRNKPDIFWDKSGSGNSFVGNNCNTSVPSSSVQLGRYLFTMKAPLLRRGFRLRSATLFTEVRGRVILGRPYAGSCISKA